MLLVCGYPKTGNTWLQVIISYIANPEASLNGTAPPLPNIFTHAMPDYNSLPYDQQEIVIDGIETARCVLLVRHPGDVLVSLFMHNRYREKKPLYTGTADEMVYDKVYGIQKYLKFYQWWEQNINRTERHCIVRYEDMLQDTYTQVCRVLEVFKAVVSRRHIQNAIQFGSFNNMKCMEKTHHLKKWSPMKPSSNFSANAMKVREGKAGNYINIFQHETIQYIHAQMKHLSVLYGYAQ